MRYISQIFIRKTLGAWSSGISFASFYFNYSEREELLTNSKKVKCVDQEGEIISTDDILPIYREMERRLIQDNNNAKKLSFSSEHLPLRLNYQFI